MYEFRLLRLQLSRIFRNNKNLALISEFTVSKQLVHEGLTLLVSCSIELALNKFRAGL